MAAGYSGTPLAKKLGIQQGATIAVLGAPDGFAATLAETLPDDVAVRRRAIGTNVAPGPAGGASSVIGCYPGSFNPPTVAHLAVAEAAVEQAGLHRLDLVISRVALGKEDLSVPSVADRMAVLEDVASTRPWLGVAVTDAQLLVDVAAGYGVLVLGADKWAQVLDPDWYGSIAARDDALVHLPRVLVAPRAGVEPTGVEVLRVADHLAHVSATAARAGATEHMLPEAAAFDARTGAWSDPDRYRAERAGGATT